MRVNFHCHSTLSDGELPPGQLAGALARAGVEYAALTDHDTTQGLAAFETALTAHGIGCLAGVEITAGDPADALHILAYGFDPENAALQLLLARHRSYRTHHHLPASDALAKMWAWLRRRLKLQARVNLTEMLPSTEEIIRTVHKAGGLAFLAHPLAVTQDPEQLSALLTQLKAIGLDGIEAVYSAYNASQRELLLNLARKHGLLVSGGSDFHSYDLAGLNRLAVDIPKALWNAFSEAHGLGPAPVSSYAQGKQGAESRPSLARRQLMPPRKPVGRRRRFALRIVLPTLLATALFITTIYAIILPALSDNLLQRKREMIKELTNSAWSILAGYEDDATAGLITRSEAQQRAVERIQHMRYGSEQKDYFWITDMQPRMIMHPYRTDLNGADLSDFKDFHGTAMFVEFVEIAQAHGEGYVDYYWQWKDNPDRVVPKESFVKRFAPWDWVIGTGIYLDDVQREIDALTGKLNRLCWGLTSIIVLLLAWITWESLRIETQRNSAEFRLRESHEKYAALAAAATEGTLMVLDGRCTYANSTLSGMLGYAPDELAGMELSIIVARDPAQGDGTMARLNAVLEGQPTPPPFEGQLLDKEGVPVNCLLTVTRFAVAGQSGAIITARDLSRRRRLEAELGQSRRQLHELAEKLNIGVFQVTVARDPVFLELSTTARRILSLAADVPADALRLLDLIPDEDERRLIAGRLEAGQSLHKHPLVYRDPAGGLAMLELTLIPVSGEAGLPGHCDGIIEDISTRQPIDLEHDHLLQEYYSSLLFLNEPLANTAAGLVCCPMHTPVARAAQMLSRAQASCLAITTPDSGEVIGVVTDYDLRERVLAADGDSSSPVYTIMSAPVESLPETAPVYEAIQTMQQRGISHIAVHGADGRIAGIVRNSELVQFHKYSAAVITSKIQRAATVDDIAAAHKQLPQLVQSLLDSGARPRNINRVMTRMGDAIVERLLELAHEELGPAPCSYCYLALGSEGRGEQTLATDQDNALILDDERPAEAIAYFERFSELVSSWLHRAGYRYCPGGVMAANPKWRMPLNAWQRSFQNWITGSNPEDLLMFNIFFDFRCTGGNIELLNRLRGSILKVMSEYPPFMLHMAQNALHYKPPLSLMGRLVVEHGGDKPNTLNIKEAMLGIVNFARLYGMQHQLTETNTLDRLRKLCDLQVLNKFFYEETATAYSYMMELRLRHQADLLAAGAEPDNAINPKLLNQMQETMLRQSFALGALIRKKISLDFLGMSQ